MRDDLDHDDMESYENYDIHGWHSGEPPVEPPHPLWTYVVITMAFIGALLVLAFTANLVLAAEPPATTDDGGEPGVVMQACSPVAEQLAFLKKRYGEEVVFVGQSPAGMGASVVTASETGSWTILVSRGSLMCAITGGDGFKLMSLGKRT